MVGGGAGHGTFHNSGSARSYPPASPSPVLEEGLDVALPQLRGSPRWFIPMLALGGLGIQLVWSTEMAFASPYLLELGLSKAAMAAVFVAGPLSGLLVQPLVGASSDRCTHRWGRRRPYLAAAIVLCATSLLLLGYARSISHTVLLGGDPAHVERLTLLLAVVSIFGIDFSVNAVMSVDRALILDILPASHQALGNAWAVRLTSTGLLLGFLVGNLDLPHTFPFSRLSFIWRTSFTENAPASEAQIKCMSVMTTFFLLVTHAATAYAAIEEVLPSKRGSGGDQERGTERPRARMRACIQSLLGPVRELRATAAALPAEIWAIFRIQFFNWIAMYPLLFWGTVWIGSIYRQQDHPGKTDDEVAESGTRLGSLAMFYQSLVSLSISVIVPLLLPSTTSPSEARVPLLGLPLPIWNVSLPSLWALSHFVFALAMLFTWPAAWWDSTRIAVAVIATAGLSVATANWIPFTLLGVLVHDEDEGSAARPATTGSEAERLLDESSATTRQRSARRSRGDTGANDGEESPRKEGTEGADDEEEDGDLDPLSFGADRDIEQARQERIRANDPSKIDGQTRAGAVLGLHNVSIVAGQLAVTAIASVVFAIMEGPSVTSPSAVSADGSVPAATRPGKRAGSEPTHSDPDAIGMILRIGMVSAAIAGVLAARLRARMARTHPL